MTGRKITDIPGGIVFVISRRRFGFYPLTGLIMYLSLPYASALFEYILIMNAHAKHRTSTSLYLSISIFPTAYAYAYAYGYAYA